jgi:hypothetical protein
MDSEMDIALENNQWVVRWRPPRWLAVDATLRARSAYHPLALPGIADRPTARLEQVHGCQVAVVEKPGTTPGSDAAVTTVAGLALAIRVADCVPVFLAVPGGVALAHAGWRGTASEISSLTVAALIRETGDPPSRLWAFLGPSIGPCCYEVGDNVKRNFAGDFLSGRRRNRLDLWAANRGQLEAAGVPPRQILDSKLCTRCHQHLFHSHRGSAGKLGRLEALLMRHEDAKHEDPIRPL